ncbi:RsmB/NOP family class I SAM-dependent RNA methyltransferase [Aeromicrobium sp.]
MIDPVRTVAFDALRAVEERDAYVNLILPGMLRERGIDGRDAAFATELTHGTLRRQGTYDAIINLAVSKGIATVEPPVLDVLRLGAHQILSMRTPSHAAVSTCVDLVRSSVGHKPVAFTNAVLRKISQNDLDSWLTRATRGKSKVEALSIIHSHPIWIIEALNEALGGDWDETVKLLIAQNESPKVTLVARPGLCEPDELPGEAGRFSPYARYLDAGDPGAIPAVVEGRAGVQDEASQLVAIALADSPIVGHDSRWLDLCAGPGGKAALLGAIAAQRGAELVANEVTPHRVKLVEQSLRKLPNTSVTTHDGREGPWESGSFDRVLVDAPCTGLGALRRRPESRWRRMPSDLDQLVPLQKALLNRALELVRPGGVVCYATCSPHLAETRGVIDAVLAGRSDVSAADPVQWWPHIHGTDAMFSVILTRTA